MTEKTTLENQIVIMEALLLMATTSVIQEQLKERIRFTKALLRGLV